MNFIKSFYSSIIIAGIISFASSSYAVAETIGVLVFDGVLTSDITAPIEVFGEASNQAWFSDYKTILISVNNTKTVTTEQGLKIFADKVLKDHPKVDILLIPSSYSMGPLLGNKDLISYIRKTSKTASWVASNCSGALLLAEAGILDGKKATTWAGGEDDFKRSYPKVNVQFDVNYVIDGNVLTSNGSLVSYEAALVLLSKVASEKQSEKVSATLQYQRIAK